MESVLASEFRAPNSFVPIADLARRLGITPRALRHYQDQGLIRSHRIARNVRAYDRDTVALVETIVALRDVDLPLAAIREILALREEPQAQAQVLRSALDEALADKQRQIAKVHAMLDALTDPPVAPAAPRFSNGIFGQPIASALDAGAAVQGL